MGQKIFYQWKDDDLTWDLSRQRLGILEPGLYRGFDADLSQNDMNLRLRHNVTGATEIDQALATSAPFGVVVTTQGAVVRDDTNPIILPINTTGAQGRIDTVYLEHYYVTTPGGIAASYGVIQGTPAANPVAPALTNPATQIVLGYLYLPPLCTDLYGGLAEWTRPEVPAFANDPSILFTHKIQTSKKHKTFNSLSFEAFKDAAWVNVVGNSKNVDFGGQDSNIFRLPNFQANRTTIVDFINPGTGSVGKPIFCFTQQGVTIGDNANILCIGGREINAGQGFFVMGITGVTGVAFGKKWLVFQAGEALRGSYNKFGALQALAGLSGMIINGGNEDLDPQQLANFLQIDNISSGVSTLSYIKSQRDTDGNTPANGESGTRLVLQFTAPATIIHNRTSAPAPPTAEYKPVYTPNSQNVTVRANGFVEVIEYDTHWMVIGVMDDWRNLWDLYASRKQMVQADYDVINGFLNISGTARHYDFEAPKQGTVNDIKVMGQPAPDGLEITLRCTSFFGASGLLYGVWNFSAGTNFGDYDPAHPTIPNPNLIFFTGMIWKFVRMNGKWLMTSALSYQFAIDRSLQDQVTVLANTKADKSIDTWHRVADAGEPGWGPGWGFVTGGGVHFKRNDVGMVSVFGRASYAGVGGAIVFAIPAAYRRSAASIAGGTPMIQVLGFAYFENTGSTDTNYHLQVNHTTGEVSVVHPGTLGGPPAGNYWFSATWQL